MSSSIRGSGGTEWERNRRRSASSPVHPTNWNLTPASNSRFAGTSAGTEGGSSPDGDVVDEIRPLLSEQFARSHHASISQPHNINEILRGYNTINDDNDTEDTQSKFDLASIFTTTNEYFSKKSRFWWFTVLGILSIMTLHLSFLPRTSLSRDFRRWHGLRLTNADIKRSYLVFSGLHGVTDGHNDANEENLNNWLTNFTELNARNPTNLVSSDNIELESYVESHFNQFGFRTDSFTYNFPDCQEPLSSSLKLIDTHDRSVLYDAKLLELKSQTPSYNTFGVNGTIKGDYVFVNEATKEDYQLLSSSRISVADKIVIAKTSHILSVAEQLQISQEFGVAGLISYTDSSSYEQSKLDVLKSAVSRHSVVFEPIGRIHNLTTPSIPSIPVSFRSIKPILDTFSRSSLSSSMNKFEVLLNEWDYPPTKNDDTLELELTTTFTQKSPRKLTNIVGSLKGILNDGEVVIGASRDSMTSSDPLSSHAVMFEMMRNFQRLIHLGWKPLRNIRFISWDGTHSGLSGSQFSANDTEFFNPRQPILAYINIDGAAVTGSKFKVDSNPMMNELLIKTAKFIPFPKSSSKFRTLPENNGPVNVDHEDDYLYSTLFHYWRNQDNVTINNNLGNRLQFSDALVFQNHMNTPIINVKFENDPKRDSAIYVPNSNYYSYNWLMKQEIDDDLLLHGSLVRYLGLLAVSLSEHEVVDVKTATYMSKMSQFFDSVLEHDQLAQWGDRNVSNYALGKFSVYYDMKADGCFEGKTTIKFSDLIHYTRRLLQDLVSQSEIFDGYLKGVQGSLIEDYAWYKALKKIHIYAKFKVANYKLLHLEKELVLKPKDYIYLFGDDAYEDTEKPINTDRDTGMSSNAIPFLPKTKELWLNHIVYGVPKFSPNQDSSYHAQRDQHSLFMHLQQAINEPNFELTVKWLVVTYEKLKNLRRKIA